MRNITILAAENSVLSTIASPMDIFLQAGVLWNIDITLNYLIVVSGIHAVGIAGVMELWGSRNCITKREGKVLHRRLAKRKVLDSLI